MPCDVCGKPFDIVSRCGHPIRTAPPAPPKHPFELTIRIGGNDFDYVKRTAQDIATHIAECGENCSLASGGWGGCHSVDIEKRDITPEAYRAELEAWSSAK